MDVRSIVDVEPEVEHNGTVPVWYLVKPREMHDLTDGGSLELVNEFEVAAPLPPGAVLHLAHRFLERARRTVRAGLGDRVPAVVHGHQRDRERDLVPAAPVGIALAVEAFVVPARERHERREARGRREP